MDGSASKVSFQAVFLCALLAFSLKLTLLINTYGTNDVLFWERNLVKIQADGGLALYRGGAQIFRDGALVHVEPFNQPPFMIHALQVAGFAMARTGLPMGFWIRLASTLADIGSFWLVWRLVKPKTATMALLALSPVSIMVSGFHGNTDPEMIFFLLLSLYFLEARGWILAAGLAFGMAMNIKIVPVVFAPAILLYLPSMKRRAQFALGAAAVFCAGSIPYLAQDPGLVVLRVFGYQSGSRIWGISRFLHLYALGSGNLGWLLTGYLAIGKALLLATLVAAAIWMNWRPKKPEIFVQCGFLAFLFVFWTPGFGLQYLAWLVPWVVVLSGWPVLFWYASSGLFLCAAYTYWSRGIPWYFANMLDSGNLPSPAANISLELLAWIAVGCVAYAYWRRLGALGGTAKAPSEDSQAAGFTSRR